MVNKTRHGGEAVMKGKSTKKDNKDSKDSKKGVSVKSNLKAGARRIWST